MSIAGLVDTDTGAAVDPDTRYATAAQGTDARAPTAHAASHATAGGDPVTPAAIGAVPETRTVNGLALSADIVIVSAPAFTAFV